jgi:hypothetical protein
MKRWQVLLVGLSVLFGVAHPAVADENALASLERSFWLHAWLHASLTPLAQRGYWEPGFPACLPPTDQEIGNAANVLTGPYAANRLYLVYHHEISLDEAQKVFLSWRHYCPPTVQLVPTLLLRMYNTAETEVFTPEELHRLVEFFQRSVNRSRIAVYDVHAHRDQGPALIDLAKQYPKGLIRVGIQPDEKLQPPFVTAVQDTWSGFCHGKTNTDWQAPGFGAETLRRWVQERNQEHGRVVWDLIAVAWDYSATERGGYPGYDDAAKNMPLPAGRNQLAVEEILRTVQGLGGFSSDLLILQANSRVHDGRRKSIYETLKRGEVYQGYYSEPFKEIVGIFNRLSKGTK